MLYLLISIKLVIICMSDVPRRKLVFRLSSLGDVVLASTVLEVARGSSSFDWVVSKEFVPLLEGHPAIGRVWAFDRSEGFWGWWRLCRRLALLEYEEVWDLHVTIRTRIARLCFIGYLNFARSKISMAQSPRWKKFNKERWKMWGVCLFRRSWPRVWAPRAFVERFAIFAGGTGCERPNLTHLVQQKSTPIRSYPYYCVMPGSKWPGKCWPAEKFLEVIRLLSLKAGPAVILGGKRDQEADKLLTFLQKDQKPHESGIGRWDLLEVASVLAGSQGYLGNDTGLAHLSEALGVPALVIFGPTSPELGFAPWRSQSTSVGVALGCRPCGKDGRRCYRIFQKYRCMTDIEPMGVAKKFEQLLEKSP
ncbi:glycosyltransferase family 9 protein [Bdellovibrionota bacterium FG-1]